METKIDNLDFLNETYKVIEQVTETHEKFIFETIKPFCETVVDTEISKEELTNALLLWRNKRNLLLDIYMEGVNMAGDYQGCWVRFKDIEKIVNKYFKDGVLNNEKR